MFNENFNFWEITFGDLIPILTTVLTYILVYSIYKKLNKRAEKNQVKTAFLRFKRILEMILLKNEEKFLPSSAMPFFVAQSQIKSENLIKIGIEVFISREGFKTKASYINILDKYRLRVYGTPYGFDETFTDIMDKENTKISRDKAENILLEMINHARKYYGLKLNKNLAKFN